MAEFKDLTNMRFGRLCVIGISRKVQSGKRERYYWNCKCDCGNTKEVRTDCLTTRYHTRKYITNTVNMVSKDKIYKYANTVVNIQIAKG